MTDVIGILGVKIASSWALGTAPEYSLVLMLSARDSLKQRIPLGLCRILSQAILGLHYNYPEGIGGLAILISGHSVRIFPLISYHH